MRKTEKEKTKKTSPLPHTHKRNPLTNQSAAPRSLANSSPLTYATCARGAPAPTADRRVRTCLSLGTTWVAGVVALMMATSRSWGKGWEAVSGASGRDRGKARVLPLAVFAWCLPPAPTRRQPSRWDV